MTQSFSERLAQPALDQIQTAIQLAYQAGYEQALMDNKDQQ
jgi:hypothetical protein